METLEQVKKPINKVLIANRGAIAVRIARTVRDMGKVSVAVYASEDIDSRHIDLADEAHCLGTGPVSDTYLNQDKLISIALRSGADAIHPGYGFLSENTAFEARCAQAGIRFLGPTSEHISIFGLKHSARELAAATGVPMLPGSGLLSDATAALAAAETIGYPVILKSTAGGGGIGMRVCDDAAALAAAFDAVKRLALGNFGDGGVFLERYVARARHVEVQVIGDGAGKVIAIGDRDCSAQRRQQKVIEECPAPGLSLELRARLASSAEELLAAVNYRSAGTVEFVFDETRGEAYFLEVNTRLQVEHGVTEMVYGIDLVRWMIQLAEGELPPLDTLRAQLAPRGHAMQARIYAEDPAQDFRPAPGLLTEATFAQNDVHTRVDYWVVPGTQISPSFDPMIAKVIYHGEDRNAARLGLREALGKTTLFGTETNLGYLVDVLETPEFVLGTLHTSMLSQIKPGTDTIRVLAPGTMTTIQDYPGRVGYWHVGVPPSGPFDALSFRLGNALLGNVETSPGLEMTVQGPDLEIGTPIRFVLTGADMQASLDGTPVETGRVYLATAGSRLVIGQAQGAGLRGYLLVAGGILCADYLGSAATFTLGQFGGHCGRALRGGDVLHIEQGRATRESAARNVSVAMPAAGDPWLLRVIYGPHGAPDFFTESDIRDLFGTPYEVHFNSSRTGVRLIGPRPTWARENGGEAGLHPSNIHDNAYAIGAIDFTGDMPVILGPDGPSLGGFVCPATVIRADRWKLGQLKPGDQVQFVPVSISDALEANKVTEAFLDSVGQGGVQLPFLLPAPMVAPLADAVLLRHHSVADPRLEMVYRCSGDDYLLIEIGEQVLDVGLRFFIHALQALMAENQLDGMLEMTPGIRSLQVHYVPEICSLEDLLAFIQEMDRRLGSIEDIEVPARVVHLPLSFDDPACQEAIDKYLRLVRPDAPWGPSNLEFIRRINGLDDVDAVRRIVFDASYLVLGLGDVYLGAPVATPLDPGQRLVTTKYNPARTWTAENSVGIGGAYLCIYGMEGPGGYQFVGRTIQMWNRYRKTNVFELPWLLRFFDQIRFYPVEADELLATREAFIRGRFTPEIEETTFSLKDHRAFVSQHEAQIGEFRQTREAAFAAELSQWKQEGLLSFEEAPAIPSPSDDEAPLPAGQVAVLSQVSGNVWQLRADVGDVISDGDTLMVLESMKMELPVQCPVPGKIIDFLVKPGQQVLAGQRLAVMESLS